VGGFYRDSLLIADNPRNRNDVLEQVIWNNKFITFDKKLIYYPQWRQAGILKIKDLFDTQQNCFPPFDAFINKFNVKCSYSQYYGLVSFIPYGWKKILHNDCEQRSTLQIIIEEITCTRIYTKLLSPKHAPPPTCEKKLNSWLLKRRFEQVVSSAL